MEAGLSTTRQTLASEFLATLEIELLESFHLGHTPFGSRRIDIFRGGCLKGPRIEAKILNGGSDALLRRSDGAIQPDVRLTVETGDGALIYVTYRAVRRGPPDIMAALDRGENPSPTSYYLRSVPFFETGAEDYAWLNQIVTVGVGRREPQRAIYDIFQIG